MKTVSNKYVAYLNNDYFMSMCEEKNAKTIEEKDDLRNKILQSITEILDSNTDCAILLDSFYGPKGDITKSVEIVRLEYVREETFFDYLKRKIKRRKS